MCHRASAAFNPSPPRPAPDVGRQDDRQQTRGALSELLAGGQPLQPAPPSADLLQLTEQLQALAGGLRESLATISQAGSPPGPTKGGGSDAPVLDDMRVVTIAARLEACAVATVGLQHAVMSMERSVRDAAVAGGHEPAGQLLRPFMLALAGAGVGLLLGLWRFGG